MRTVIIVLLITLAACDTVPVPCSADMHPADMAVASPDSAAAPDLGPTVHLPVPCDGKVPCHP